MDLHPSAQEKVLIHRLLPGYSYSLQDPQDAFFMRQEQTFNSDKNTYTKNQRASINIASQDAFLDVDNAHIRCQIILNQQFAAHDTANSQMGGSVLDQLGSSIIRRVIVKCSGQVLCDLPNFNIYHHIRMLRENIGDPSMAYYNEIDQNVVSFPVGADMRPDSIYTANHFQSIQKAYNKTDKDRTRLLVSRMKEDIKRNLKYYKVSTAEGADLTTNLNNMYAPRNNSDPETYTILFKLSDLPCFSNKQYFPLFAVKGGLQIELEFEDPTYCSHYLSPLRANADGNVILSYSVEGLICKTPFIYPKPDFIQEYMQKSVSQGMALYKCTYAESSYLGWTSAQATLLFNTSMARLWGADFICRELGTQSAGRLRHLLSVGATGISSQYRGAKWFSPILGNQTGEIQLKVNGVIYPQSSGEILKTEYQLKEFSEDNLGKFIGMDPERYFLDQKDPSSDPLQDVSGLNTSQNNQVQLVLKGEAPQDNTQILGIFYGEQIIQFTLSGQLLIFR